MAELLVAKGWPEPGSIGPILRDALPDEYVVVAGPTARGHELDAVVVGPAGLTVVYAKDWQGAIYPAQHGPWISRQFAPGAEPQATAGEELQIPNPEGETKEAERALRAFLADEFPGTTLPIYHLVVIVPPETRLETLGLTQPPAVKPEGIAQAFDRLLALPDAAQLGEHERDALGTALRERQITSSERTSSPFVFRSGGRLGSGKKAWTIRAAIDIMDAHPDAGIFHLRNGSLARWFSEQGAEHLAELARDVVQHWETDPRVSLETFLLGTGLVPRPHLRVRPGELHLGHVLAGESAAARLTIKKAGGRGYLFGRLSTSDPWLRIEPKAFQGSAVCTISVDTDTMPISDKPAEGHILIESSASEEPVPVRVRVVGMPSPLNRFLVRPLLAALLAALIGAALGWFLGTEAGDLPGWLRAQARLGAASLPSPAFWAVVVGLPWGILGWYRGLRQPHAWPVLHAAGRWLLRALAWGLALALVAAVARWSWGRLGPGFGSGLSAPSLLTLALLALSFAVVPAVVGEVRSARPGKGQLKSAHAGALRIPLRPLRVAVLGIAFLLLVVLVLPIVARAWQEEAVPDRLAAARAWAEEKWTAWEESLGTLVERLRTRNLDRRATPLPSPYPTRVPTRTPAAGGESP